MIYREAQTQVPPPSAAELMGAITIREEYAAELQAAGLYEAAKRQYLTAEAYRRQVDAMRESASA